MSYTIEKDSTHNGLRYVVIMTSIGHRCGYVGVNMDHPLYGKYYSDPTPESLYWKMEEVKSGPIGKRGIIDILCESSACEDGRPLRIGTLFDVHGGITYTSSEEHSNYPVESNLWWFGYDCAHCGDARDLDTMSPYMRELEEEFPTGGILRSLEHCIKECESLADQLVSLVKIEEGESK